MNQNCDYDVNKISAKLKTIQYSQLKSNKVISSDLEKYKIYLNFAKN